MSDVTPEQFQAVVAIVGDKSIKPLDPKTANSFATKQSYYGLYKRSTVGKLLPPYDDEDTETDKRPKSRPGMLQPEARAKYDGWKACQDMSKQEAMNAYVELAKKHLGAPVEEVLK